MSKLTIKQYYDFLDVQDGHEGEMSSSEYYEYMSEEDIVEESDHDKHRWYTTYTVVSKIVIEQEERFFAWEDWDCSGDGSKWDNGYEFDIANVVEVFPKEVKTIKYVTEEYL